jgi:hypothetical protein
MVPCIKFLIISWNIGKTSLICRDVIRRIIISGNGSDSVLLSVLSLHFPNISVILCCLLAKPSNVLTL